MTRAAIAALACCACTPAAQSVGGWTDASSGAGPGSTGSADATGSSGTTAPDSGTTTAASDTGSGTTAAAEGSSGATAPGPWIVAVTQEDPPRLLALALDDGATVELCAWPGLAAPQTLAMLDDGTIVGADPQGPGLWRADPCDCSVTPIAIEPAPALHAMTERADGSLVGADASRSALLQLELAPPAVLAALDFAPSATIAALVDDGDALLAVVVGSTPELWRIDATDASVLAVQPLALAQTPGGLTRAPAQPQLLACDDDGALWRIDPRDGSVAATSLQLPAPCRALATPHGTVACVDAAFE
ncbi:MAG: hypothetical protein U0168_28245 [Nannocystaceae bacterium]